MFLQREGDVVEVALFRQSAQGFNAECHDCLSAGAHACAVLQLPNEQIARVATHTGQEATVLCISLRTTLLQQQGHHESRRRVKPGKAVCEAPSLTSLAGNVTV